jgi:hypothetical protein
MLHSNKLVFLPLSIGKFSPHRNLLLRKNTALLMRVGNAEVTLQTLYVRTRWTASRSGRFFLQIKTMPSGTHPTGVGGRQGRSRRDCERVKYIACRESNTGHRQYICSLCRLMESTPFSIVFQ